MIRITAETSRQLLRYKHVNPELHLVCSNYFFGIKELRTRIGIAFEDSLVWMGMWVADLIIKD